MCAARALTRHGADREGPKRLCRQGRQYAESHWFYKSPHRILSIHASMVCGFAHNDHKPCDLVL